MLYRFLLQNDEGDGWVVKLPYTTNGQFVEYCSSEDDIFAALSMACANFGQRISYAMLQPCMKNKKEYKVVYYKYGAKYVATIKQKHTNERAFSTHPHEFLFTFANNAVMALSIANSCFLEDGVLRIDIFQTASNRLVVNEFESLEACIYSSEHGPELHAKEWAKGFWYEQLKDALSLAV